MKKIIIYYFSGTGNTWWLSNELKKQLDQKGHQTLCHSIETLTDDEVQTQLLNLDHIVIGFPVYGSTAPKLMLDFINHLPDAKFGQSVSIFGTQAIASGDTAYYISKLLDKKGYHVLHTMHFIMMTNLHVPRFKFIRPKNDDRVAKLHEKTLPKVQKLSDAIISNKKMIAGKNLFGFLIGSMQRTLIHWFVAKASSDFEVDKSRCIKCNQCVRICPTKNITFVNDSYEFKESCMLCMRCYSYCPKHAILIGEASIDEVKYPRYKGPLPSFDVTVLTKHL